MRLNFRASFPHYRAHLEPILATLPPEWDVREVQSRPLDEEAQTPLLAASYMDIRFTRDTPIIYVEHGAGQTYDGDRRARRHPSYPGGSHLGLNVIGYVCPSEAVAARWDAPAAAVGCPKMDRWITAQGIQPWVSSRVVAITFHWDCHVCPETRSAWRWYEERMGAAIANFRAQGWKVLGHGHPRDEIAARRWAHLGVEWVPCEDDVFERASLLIADNTSLMYEFASLGRPVVALNAPWYRRDVEHGLRFWEHVPGIQVDTPDQLVALDLTDVQWSGLGELHRSAAVAHAYAHTDGHAAERAASFIVELLDRYG